MFRGRSKSWGTFSLVKSVKYCIVRGMGLIISSGFWWGKMNVLESPIWPHIGMLMFESIYLQTLWRQSEHWFVWENKHKYLVPTNHWWILYQQQHRDCLDLLEVLLSLVPTTFSLSIARNLSKNLIYLTPKYIEKATVNLTSSTSRIWRTSRSTLTW